MCLCLNVLFFVYYVICNFRIVESCIWFGKEVFGIYLDEVVCRNSLVLKFGLVDFDLILERFCDFM